MRVYNIIRRQCQKGDRRAQLEFYMLFYKSVYNCCFRILGNPQESEEVMQETFLKVLDKIDEYTGDADSMKRILKRIAINRSIDICRKRKIRFIELNEGVEYTDEPEEEEHIEMQLEAIHKMMQLLPQGYRMILNLHLIENLDYADIAVQLQISPSTVRSQYIRAKQKLVQLIKEHYPHEQFIG